MRVSIASILLAGGALGLNACAATADQSPLMTMAERAAECRAAGQAPTGRNTGNPSNDCRGVGLHDQRAARESGARGAASTANAVVDRSLRRGY
ncbi:hypothetical protein [Brevundimonas sp.]|uniref:hypothetical protein n=1 Tax=Brevundimonas sp. TaxID=1871086 RepID=UPI002D6D1647|nr:hypothetical protein [Brevundimonas sp.]HYC69514.1 hypothetical protein [Brevundimonas sp.]